MNEVMVAESLRGSFVESVLLQLNECRGRMSADELDAFTGDRRATVEVMTNLHDLRLAEQPNTAGGELTPFGRRTADLILRSLRPGGRRRADAVQRSVLGWLRGRSIAPGSIREFLVQTESVVFGVVVEPAELEEAAALLEARAFIECVDTAEVRFLHPAITPDGVSALMSNVMISEYGKQNATMISNDFSSRVTFGDNATARAVMAGGSGNVQSVVQVIGPDQWAAVAAKATELQDLARELDGADGVSRHLREIAEESKSARRPEVVKDLMVKLLGASAVVLGTETGNALVQGIAELAQMLN